MFSTLLHAISQHNDIKDEKYDLLRDDGPYDDISATVHQYDKGGVDYIASLTAKTFIEQHINIVLLRSMPRGSAWDLVCRL